MKVNAPLLGFIHNYKVYGPASLSYVIPIVHRSASQAESVCMGNVLYPASRFSLAFCENLGAHPGSRYCLTGLGPWFAPGEGLPRPAARRKNHSLSDMVAVYG